MNSINFGISFGKKVVGEFKITKLESDGKGKTVPVQVLRLEEGDYEDCFTYENTKKINMGNFFTSRQPQKNEINYIVEKKSNGKLLGIADCKKENDEFILETIGTSKNPKYCGIGRVLLAGIVNDIKGKYSEISVPTALPSAWGFYDKCHFDWYDDDFSFTLDKSNFDKLIKDAKRK